MMTQDTSVARGICRRGSPDFSAENRPEFETGEGQGNCRKRREGRQLSEVGHQFRRGESRSRAKPVCGQCPGAQDQCRSCPNRNTADVLQPLGALQAEDAQSGGHPKHYQAVGKVVPAIAGIDQPAVAADMQENTGAE